MQIFITAFVIIVTAWMARYYLKQYITNQAEAQLKESLSLIKQSIENQKISPIKWCQGLRLNWKTRYTLISSTGTVLCDNFLRPELLENQLNNPEVSMALQSGSGSDIRYDRVEKTNLIMGAISLESFANGKSQKIIIRQAVPLKKLDQAMKDLDRSSIVYLFPLLAFASLVSLWGALQLSFPLRSLVKRVAKLKRSNEEDSDLMPLMASGDEWSLVEKEIDRARQGLENSLDHIYNENAKMSTLLTSITDSIFAVGLKDNILFANGQFRKNFLPKELREKDFSNFKTWEIFRDLDVQSLFHSCLENGKAEKKRAMELPIKGGKRKEFFDVKVNPLKNQNEEVFGAVGVFHNVTENRLADQIREDFVANVSHEVRTPLTAMKGYVQILKEMPPENLPNSRNILDKIERNSDRLAVLFQDILQLSVIESQGNIPKETVIAEDITKSVIANIKQSHYKKKIHINCEFHINEVWANPALLEQVLNNLVDNAFKYTCEEGKINISWDQSEDGKWAVLTLSDSGIGIPKEHHGRLFERFYRVDPARSREIGGTGLGLAIVKHIIQGHDGRITVESKLAHGTTFKVFLPAHQVKAI
jgi:two-component system, OmpR family, phosphate regulon sensor histidine kinase PhoR